MRTMGGRPVLHAALPEGRGRAVVLPEARAGQRAGVAGDDDGADRQRHAVAGAGGRRRRARRVGGQPRLPGLPRLAAPRRRPRARRRAAPRPRPAARHRLRRRCARPRCELKALLDELGIAGYPKTTGNRGLHVYVRLQPRWDSYEVRSAAVAVGARARAPPARHPHRRAGGRRSAASGSSSTTTRTPRTRRCSARGRSAPARARRSRRRCAGTSSTSIHPDELTLATVPGRVGARRRPVGRRSTTRRSRSSRCWR